MKQKNLIGRGDLFFGFSNPPQDTKEKIQKFKEYENGYDYIYYHKVYPMKKKLLFLFSFLFFTNCYSQDSFIKLLFDNNGLAVHDASRPICKTADGNYVITSYGFFNSTAYYLIIKLDSSGNIIWSNKIGPISGTGEPSDIQQATDNGFFILGHSHGYSAAGEEALLIKTDSNGIFQWAKYIDNNYGSEGISLTCTIDSCVIITGQTGVDSVKWGEIPIIKIQNNGSVLFSEAIGQNQSDEIGYSIKTTHNGNIIIAGTTQKYDSLYSLIQQDILVTKVDPIGNILWSKDYDNGRLDQALDIIETSDNGFAIIGIIADTVSIFYNTNNIAFIKLDSSGNIEFSKSIGRYILDEDYGISIQQKNNGLFLLAGLTYGNYTGDSRIFMIELDQNGDIIWANKYFYYSSSFGHFGPSFIVDGKNIFMGGVKNDNAPVDAFPFFFKLDTSGFSCEMSAFSPDIIPGDFQMQLINLNDTFVDFLSEAIINCSSFAPNENILCSTAGIQEEMLDDKNINIYPNPATNQLKIGIVQYSTIEISNMEGQIIKTIIHETGELTIDIENFYSGVYIVKVLTDKEIVTKKFIKL